MHVAPNIRFLCAAITCIACGDDTTASDASAVVSADAAADSGSEVTGSRVDAGRSEDASASDASRDRAVEPNAQRVTLRFHAQLGDQPFGCGSNYDDQGTTEQTITLRDLRLFVQDVALVDANGGEVAVQLDTRDPWQTADVALLDFEDGSGDCFGDAQTNREITGVVPSGEYRALRFSHGVPEQLNHADPKTFPPPLQTPGMSWNWLLGLRFVRFEVGALPGAALDADAGADTGSFSLHVGSTGCAGNQNQGTIECKKPNRSRIELADFELGRSEIVLDVSPLLRGIDLGQTVECHSGTAVCDPLFEALGVDYGTGQPGRDQRVFRLK